MADHIAAGVLKATLLPDGTIEFRGQRYVSPSAAGGAAPAIITGRKMSTNGWSFWQVEGDGGKPRTLADVRGAFQKQGNWPNCLLAFVRNRRHHNRRHLDRGAGIRYSSVGADGPKSGIPPSIPAGPFPGSALQEART